MGKIKLPNFDTSSPINFHNINHGFRYASVMFLEALLDTYIIGYNGINGSSFELKGIVCKVVQNTQRLDINFFQLWKSEDEVLLYEIGFKQNDLLYIAQDTEYYPSGSHAAQMVSLQQGFNPFNSEMNICLFSITDLSYVVDFCDELVFSWAAIQPLKSFYFDLPKSGPYYCLKCEGKFKPTISFQKTKGGISPTTLTTTEPPLPTIVLSAPCPPFWRPEITGLVDIRHIQSIAIDHQES